MSDAEREETLAELRTVADYQFGAGAGEALFPSGGGDAARSGEPGDGGSDDGDSGDSGGDDAGSEALTIHRSTGGRPRQIVAAEGRLVSYGTDGRFTLGVAGGRRLIGALEAPAYRVVVGEESEPFVRDGKNAFAKFVREADPAIRPGDEVAVVRGDDTLLAVGRAELSAEAMADFETGMAVHVRDGAGPAGGDCDA
ncbi:PUA domain-containing protein [Halobellus sp. GM3]|uniref:PUA domain-containing protein n=1 Tax=Halobellus sp. GM3 TaxID=3458410 RepID=UPI00403DFAA9